jgi:hypothetical protein
MSLRDLFSIRSEGTEIVMGEARRGLWGGVRGGFREV